MNSSYPKAPSIPQAWSPEELRMDYSWVHHLSLEAIEELEQALAYAKDSGKS